MARHVLEGPRDDGRASYQIALSICKECGRGQQSAGGEFVPVGTEIVAMAGCDGQHIGCVSPRWAHDGSALHGALANDNAHGGATADDSLDANVDANLHGSAHVDANSHDARDVTLGAGTRETVRTRARQAVPPALRRRVLLRDHRCCRVPGCRNSRFLDLHHVELRSDGGPSAARKGPIAGHGTSRLPGRPPRV